MATGWSLPQAQREDTVSRVAANIFTMGFIKGLPISDEVALEAAIAFERRAYTAAEVAARTTTGDRPHSESVRNYARSVRSVARTNVAAMGPSSPCGGSRARRSSASIPSQWPCARVPATKQEALGGGHRPHQERGQVHA